MFTTGTPLAALITRACCAAGAARLGMICACAARGMVNEAASEAAIETVSNADAELKLRLEI